MKVAFDALFLTLFFRPNADVHHKIQNAAGRVQHLIETLSAENTTIIIPTPVLGEFLILAGPTDGPAYLAALHESDVFEVQPFDERAAIEAAALMLNAKNRGNKRGGATGAWQKVKVDWQLAAIAKVHKVDCLYSDDKDLVSICESIDLKRKGIKDLPSPPIKETQMELDIQQPTPPPKKPKDSED